MTQPSNDDELSPEMKGACPFDQTRICGPDCMAFLPQPPEGRAYLGENWAHCHLLVNADRVGRHAAIAANELSALRKALEDSSAEAERRYSGKVDPG
jgi:hypothetical protein